MIKLSSIRHSTHGVRRRVSWVIDPQVTQSAIPWGLERSSSDFRWPWTSPSRVKSDSSRFSLGKKRWISWKEKDRCHEDLRTVANFTSLQTEGQLRTMALLHDAGWDVWSSEGGFLITCCKYKIRARNFIYIKWHTFVLSIVRLLQMSTLNTSMQ